MVEQRNIFQNDKTVPAMDQASVFAPLTTFLVNEAYSTLGEKSEKEEPEKKRLKESNLISAASDKYDKAEPIVFTVHPKEQRLIARLLDQLDADNFGTRERAQRQLQEIGLKALPQIANKIADLSSKLNVSPDRRLDSHSGTNKEVLKAAMYDVSKQIEHRIDQLPLRSQIWHLETHLSKWASRVGDAQLHNRLDAKIKELHARKAATENKRGDDNGIDEN